MVPAVVLWRKCRKYIAFIRRCSIFSKSWLKLELFSGKYCYTAIEDKYYKRCSWTQFVFKSNIIPFTFSNGQIICSNSQSDLMLYTGCCCISSFPLQSDPNLVWSVSFTTDDTSVKAPTHRVRGKRGLEQWSFHCPLMDGDSLNFYRPAFDVRHLQSHEWRVSLAVVPPVICQLWQVCSWRGDRVGLQWGRDLMFNPKPQNGHTLKSGN